MAESLANWLAVREPADVDARSASLTRAIAERLNRERPVRILDLGTGTGSNVRYLAGRLPGPQHWLAVDGDASVVAEIPARMSAWGAGRADLEVETRCMNLGQLSDPSIFAGRHLVTASALLDLVSASWLGALASRCRDHGASVLFALTYNGRAHCTPAEPEDDEIRDLLNRHQRESDKGFGPAAGPEAVDCAARSFADAGYQVRREVSDWILRPEMQELQRQLVEGWADAALDLVPDRAALIQDWLTRRIAHVRANRSHIIVGHEDLAGWLA